VLPLAAIQPGSGIAPHAIIAGGTYQGTRIRKYPLLHLMKSLLLACGAKWIYACVQHPVTGDDVENGTAEGYALAGAVEGVCDLADGDAVRVGGC
jgi:hypothetical protein